MVKGNGGDRLPAVDDLLSFILRFVQVPSRRESFYPLDDRQQDFLLLFGLTHRVRRLAQSYLRLRRAGFEVEGQILVRSALEHAVTAQWAYLARGGLDQLRASATRDQYTFVRLLAEYSTDENIEQLVAEFEAQVLSGPQLPKVTSLMELLDNNGFLRTTYKVLSQVTHVTHQAVLDAVESNENGELTLRLEPDHEVGHETLYALASCCLLSAWIVAHIEGSQDEIARLHEFAERLSMPFRLDAALPLELRRFDDPIAFEDL